MDSQDKQFLVWLANRLVFKHGYDKNDSIIRKILSLGSKGFIINDKDLDKIISKHYTGFFLEKAEDYNIGYTEHERNEIRNHVKALMVDIFNKNIPSQILK